ncbi:MAG: hypothetical protein J3K34DRAFT_458551 [Monoraphidium minutum]|nr:MAG: hypothetical protein J3K34DRAFT_458551 [Monoraphidium minutum]
MLETSGVPELEERVLGFLYANSAGLKLMATIDDAGRLLAEASGAPAYPRRRAAPQRAARRVGNAASACAASLATDAAGLASSRDALAAEIGETLFGFDGVLAAAEELEVEVVDELRSHLANLRIRLFQHISDAFDERRARRGDAGAGRWAAVRRTFAAVFGGGAGSRDEVGSALLELHDAVTTQIEAEVSEAWHVMESACNARARRLAAALNDALERLSARVEGAVEAQLDVRLEPVALRMEAPTRDAFHADLQALIENGISEVPERHVRVAERTQLEWELRRRGVCRMSRYWVQVPRTRRVVETYTAVSYNLCPQVVRDQFMQAVDTAILTTERSLPPYVREFVRRQVEAARTQAREYGDSYLASMRSALEASSAGADVRAEAHARVSGHCDAAATLRARLAGLAARVEALVPHNAGAAGLFEQVEWPSSEEEEGNEEEARREAPEALVVAAEAEAEAEAEACAESEAGADAGADAEAAGVAVAEAVAEAEAAAEGLEQVQAGDAALEAAAAAEEQDEVAAYAAAGSPPRRSASGAGSDMFSSCEELGSDELLEAQEAELAASGLLAMRPLPAAAADEAPAAAEAEEERAAAAEDAAAAAEDEAALAAAGDEEAAAAVPAAEEAAPAAEEPLAVEVAAAPEAAAAEGERAAKEEGGDEELPDAAPHHDQGAPAEADVEAAPAAAPEAPAAAGDEPEEALEAAGSEAGGSGSGGALSSYDEVASPATFRSTLSGASSGGGNELLADSLLGFGGADALLARAGASEAAIDEEEAPARSDDGGAAAPALPLPLSSSAHGSAAPAPPAAAAAPDALVCSAASIVPHAEDGGPESPALDFTRSFAEALSAAGLPPAPRPGSSSDPDDWTLVEGLAAELEAGDGADTGRAASAPRR